MLQKQKYFEVLQKSERIILKCYEKKHLLAGGFPMSRTEATLALWTFSKWRENRSAGKVFFKNLKKTFLEWRENRAASKKKNLKT